MKKLKNFLTQNKALTVFICVIIFIAVYRLVVVAPTIGNFFGMLQTTLVYGVYYAMLALGFALIFGAARVVNLYHGTFYMLGAYLFATFSNPQQFMFPTFIFVILLVLILAGIVISVIRTMKKQKATVVSASKKLTVPVVMVIFGLIPLFLLFFKVKLPVSGNLNLFIGLILSAGLVGILGIYINKYLIEPVRKEGVAVLIVTLALAFFTEKLLEGIYGSSALPVRSFVPTKPITLLMGNVLDSKRLLMVIIGVILILAIWLLMNKTKLGKGVLAVAQDKEAAALMGVNPKFVYSFAIALSAILAALAGIFTSPFLGDAAPAIWFSPLIKAFAIVILGGLGSIFGSVVAAFILAFFEKFTKYYVGSQFEEVVFLVLIVVILIARPQGLFGKKGRF